MLARRVRSPQPRANPQRVTCRRIAPDGEAPAGEPAAFTRASGCLRPWAVRGFAQRTGDLARCREARDCFSGLPVVLAWASAPVVGRWRSPPAAHPRYSSPVLFIPAASATGRTQTFPNHATSCPPPPAPRRPAHTVSGWRAATCAKAQEAAHGWHRAEGSGAEASVPAPPEIACGGSGGGLLCTRPQTSHVQPHPGARPQAAARSSLFGRPREAPLAPARPPEVP
jgi:hypothetical protein